MTRFMEEKLRLGRVLAPVISVVFFIAALCGFIYFMALQFIGFSDDFPRLKVRFMQMFENMQHWFSSRLHITSHQQADYLNKSAAGILEAMGNSLSNIFVSITSTLLLLVFVLIFTFFILYHRRLLMRFVLYLFKEEDRQKVREVVMETKTMINAYVMGLLIEMIVVGVINCLLLMLLGVNYAVLLGVMAAVLNIIPYLGIYSSIVVCMLVTFANSSGNAAIQVGVCLFVVHLLDSNILFPRIIGGRVKMNPFITIVAVVVGEYLWGVPGMFLFIPVTGVIKLVCERVEGMQAWSILIGVEEEEPRKPKKKMGTQKE
jgi:predicted PurR-regulated permease PerM